MTKDHLVTAPVGTTLKDAQEILRHHRIEKLPIVDEKGYLKGLITIKDIEKAVQYPNSARDEGGRLLCGAAIALRLTFWTALLPLWKHRSTLSCSILHTVTTAASSKQ